jgi:hypothetical protein
VARRRDRQVARAEELDVGAPVRREAAVTNRTRGGELPEQGLDVRARAVAALAEQDELDRRFGLLARAQDGREEAGRVLVVLPAVVEEDGERRPAGGAGAERDVVELDRGLAGARRRAADGAGGPGARAPPARRRPRGTGS